VIELAPSNKGFSLLIFPFAYHFLFYLGFYNYSLSFIFFFLAITVWLKNEEQEIRWGKSILLCTLITLTYFANVLTYVFLGITLGCYIICEAVNVYLQNNSEIITWKAWFKKVQFLFLLSLPSLIFFALFYFTAQFFSADQNLPTDELIKWLTDNRSLIVYDYRQDEIYTKKILYVLITFLLCIAYRRIRTYETTDKVEFKKSDVILLPFLLSLVLFFIVPDGSGAGMMSLRYCLILYILAILWISTQPLPDFSKVFVLLVLLLSFGLFFNHIRIVKDLDKHATLINNASPYLKEESVVLPVNFSDNWLEPHFSNYVGVDKSVVVLENYEASVGWFPVRWNKNMPKVLLNGKDKVEGLQWMSNASSSTNKEIDYVLLYGSLTKINEAQWTELKSLLDAEFKLTYNVEGVSLYEKKRH